MNLVLHCIILPFMMLLFCIMAGLCFALPHTVLVEHLFLLNMPCLVLRWVTFYSTQWNKRPYDHIIDWSVFTSGHWTWVAACFTGGLFSVYCQCTGWCQAGHCYEWILGEDQSMHLLMSMFLILAIKNMKTQEESIWTRIREIEQCFIYSCGYVSYRWTGSWGNIFL